MEKEQVKEQVGSINVQYSAVALSTAYFYRLPTLHLRSFVYHAVPQFIIIQVLYLFFLSLTIKPIALFALVQEPIVFKCMFVEGGILLHMISLCRIRSDLNYKVCSEVIY